LSGLGSGGGGGGGSSFGPFSVVFSAVSSGAGLGARRMDGAAGSILLQFTATPVAPVTAVPTLTEWGQIGLGALLALAAAAGLGLKRRRP
jgi:hypothetical protein